MTTSPVKSPIVLTKRGRTTSRVVPVIIAAIVIVVIETSYVSTGVLAFDGIMLALSVVITIELLLAAFLIDHAVKFAITALGIIGIFTVGCMCVYGAFG